MTKPSEYEVSPAQAAALKVKASDMIPNSNNKRGSTANMTASEKRSARSSEIITPNSEEGEQAPPPNDAKIPLQAQPTGLASLVAAANGRDPLPPVQASAPADASLLLRQLVASQPPSLALGLPQASQPRASALQAQIQLQAQLQQLQQLQLLGVPLQGQAQAPRPTPSLPVSTTLEQLLAAQAPQVALPRPPAAPASSALAAGVAQLLLQQQRSSPPVAHPLLSCALAAPLGPPPAPPADNAVLSVLASLLLRPPPAVRAPAPIQSGPAELLLRLLAAAPAAAVPGSVAASAPPRAKTAKAKSGGTPGPSKERRWMARYEELREFRRGHGHCRVPHGFAENKKLSWWVMNQRAQYQLLRQGKPSWLSEDRVKLLNELDFDWMPIVGKGKAATKKTSHKP